MFLSPLIVFSLVFTLAASLPVERAIVNHELTSANFSDSIKEGVWFINFISPKCRHCRHFAPTWERLLAYTDAQRDPGISLAQINCLAHGDICQQQNIEAYPSLIIYKDGLKTESFIEQREYERLTSFINAQAKNALLPTPIGATYDLPNPQRTMRSIAFKSIGGRPTFFPSSVPSVGPSEPHWEAEVIIYDSDGLPAEPVRVDVARETSLPETQQIFSIPSE